MEAGYIDIHNHSLYGTDDGARSLEESVAMLRQAAEEGIREVILTPHQKPDRRCADAHSIKEKTERLQKVLDGLAVPVRLYPGGEVLYSYDTEEFLKQGKASVLADSAYVLTEFLPDEEWAYIQNGLYRLLDAGYIPVLAHAERYGNLVRDLDRVDGLRESGCLIQVNSGSLTGFGGTQMKRTAKKLVKEELTDIVATDAHRASGGRQAYMKECASWLSKKCGVAYAQRLLYENAAAILEGCSQKK